MPLIPARFVVSQSSRIHSVCGAVQPGLVVTVDGTSIADGDSLAVGTRTLRYTWTDYGHISNQFRMWVTLDAIPTAVPGGTAGLCLLAVSGAVRRRRRRN